MPSSGPAAAPTEPRWYGSAPPIGRGARAFRIYLPLSLGSRPCAFPDFRFGSFADSRVRMASGHADALPLHWGLRFSLSIQSSGQTKTQLVWLPHLNLAAVLLAPAPPTCSSAVRTTANIGSSATPKIVSLSCSLKVRPRRPLPSFRLIRTSPPALRPH